jgi:radical SAM protein with 4Fe4S-binding SPASM domain
MAVRTTDRLRAHLPSLRDMRDGKVLLVWRELGQWLVMDEEAAILLSRFDKEHSVDDVLREHCRAAKKPFEVVARETLPFLDALSKRGIIGAPPPLPLPPTDVTRLSNLTFNITNRCNLQCSWCYNAQSAGSEIAVPALMNWLRAGAGYLDRHAALIILGGEPFLDQPRLLKCIGEAREFFTDEILISTNGTLLSRETPRALLNAGATVQISLDSASPAMHDAVRGNGIFHRAVASAQTLADCGVKTILSMVMTRHSEPELEPYLDLATKLGVHEVRFIPLRRIGRGVHNPDASPDLYACFQRLVEIVRRRPELSRFLRRDFFSILMTACRFSRLRANCGIGRRCLFVDADGAIFPCPNHRAASFRCGHVADTQLAGILESSVVMESIRSEYRLVNMRTCVKCPLCYWCAGDCRAEVLALTGKPDGPSPYCQAIRRVIKDLFWLIAEDWQGLARQDQDIIPWS